MAKVGERIKLVRKKRGITLDVLAEKTGLSKGFLSEVESGNKDISSSNLLLIARELRASLDWLVSGDSQKAPAQTEIVIPAELSKAAEELGLTHGETLDLLEVQRAVFARRGGTSHAPSVDDWKELHATIKSTFK